MHADQRASPHAAWIGSQRRLTRSGCRARPLHVLSEAWFQHGVDDLTHSAPASAGRHTRGAARQSRRLPGRLTRHRRLPRRRLARRRPARLPGRRTGAGGDGWLGDERADRRPRSRRLRRAVDGSAPDARGMRRRCPKLGLIPGHLVDVVRGRRRRSRPRGALRTRRGPCRCRASGPRGARAPRLAQPGR